MRETMTSWSVSTYISWILSDGMMWASETSMVISSIRTSERALAAEPAPDLPTSSSPSLPSKSSSMVGAELGELSKMPVPTASADETSSTSMFTSIDPGYRDCNFNSPNKIIPEAR